MSMKEKLGHFLQHYGSPFVVGSLEKGRIIFVNKRARELFGITEETKDLSHIFDKPQERIESLMDRALNQEHTTLLYNYIAYDKEQKPILVDLQVGYFNDAQTEVFLEIIPQRDNRMAMALHQINYSSRAEAILNFDETLSVLECNEAFLNVFKATEEHRHSHYHNHFVNGLFPEDREEVTKEIFETLKQADTFSKNIRVVTPTGDERWFRLDLEKRALKDTGEDHILVFMTNIEKQVETEWELSLLNQYLSVVQESTVDVLYRVDIKNNIMYHFSDYTNDLDVGNKIPNYVDVFMDSPVIHEDDKEAYLKNLREFYEQDLHPSRPIRFSLDKRPYQWYKIMAKKFYDSQGELIEVFGALVNVDKEEKLKEEFDLSQQYFNAFQSISNESFFTVDMKTKILRQSGKTAELVGYTGETKDFPECIFCIIHPDDLEDYKKYVYGTMNGISGGIQLRELTTAGDFQWFEIFSDVIRDKHGNVSEVIGKISNIHSTKVQEAEYSSINQYFTALQSMSGESFYAVDVKNKVLRQTGSVAEELGLPAEFYNFPESYEYKIFPEDLEQYRTFIQNSMSGIAGQTELRVKDSVGNFQWFSIISQIIHDENGDVKEFVGKMSNIQDEWDMRKQYSTLNQYFSAMQTMSKDILFHIDLKTDTFYHNFKYSQNYGLPMQLSNYMEEFIQNGYIHPEDVPIYRENHSKMLSGERMEYELRVEVDEGLYEWVQIRGVLIFDNKGKPTEIFGSMANIQSRKDLEVRASRDHLTKVYNRESFETKVKRRLKDRENTIYHTLVFIDLDDFLVCKRHLWPSVWGFSP